MLYGMCMVWLWLNYMIVSLMKMISLIVNSLVRNVWVLFFINFFVLKVRL